MPLRFDKIKILVVDDNEQMRRLIASVLEALGVARILQAPSAERAWSMFNLEQPDIVITDWHMDGMNGIELCHQIRRDPASANTMTPVILITGYSSRQRVNEARDAGVTEFLVKPFRADDVSRRIAHVVNSPRDFIDAPNFFGPERRRRSDENYTGPRRRSTDRTAGGSVRDDKWFVG